MVLDVPEEPYLSPNKITDLSKEEHGSKQSI